jgi:Spy/CpxP family protein refolding chaperone
MPLSSDFFSKRSVRLEDKTAASLKLRLTSHDFLQRSTAIALLTVVMPNAQAAFGDPNNNATHKSIMSVPSMGEDFVRAPDLNSRDLTQPRPGDFRYMKMNYATSKGDPDSARDESEAPGQPPPGGKPFPAKGGEPTGGPPPDRPPPGSNAARSDKLGLVDLTPLNLSQDQKQKIQEMRRETGRKVKDLRKTLKAKRDDLFSAAFDPDTTEAAIREKREVVRSLHEQVEDLMFDDLMAMRNMLTPEQKKHLSEVKPPPPPPGRFGPSGEGPTRMESVRLDGTKSDAFAKPNIAKSDPIIKTDSNKGPASKSDASAKSDLSKTPTPKN